MPQERIDKLIASQGALSRSDVRRLVKSGAIALNGSPVRDAGQKADPEADQITVSGRPLFISKYLYLMLDKPAGVVSRDAEQKTVIDLVPSALRRDGLFPAGRLDKDTTGFVLITNDGEFAHRILSPKKHISKTYLARLARPVDGRSIEAFRSGLVLADGTRCMEAGLQILEDDETPLRSRLRSTKDGFIRSSGCSPRSATRSSLCAVLKWATSRSMKRLGRAGAEK